MTDHSMGHGHGGGMGGHQPPASATCDPRADDSPPTCGWHNQMIVGEQTIYLSHLPMFMFDPNRHEHNFQVILEVTLTGPGNAQAIYADDRREHPRERMYTMSPAAFEMIELDPRSPRRTALMGDIFRGHLERGGEVIIGAATAQIENIVYFHGFDPDARPLDQLEYLLFGVAPDLFLAHVITRPPDFDQILGVTIRSGDVSADALRRGIRIKIPDRANTLRTRIKAGERVKARAQPAGAQAGETMELELEAGTEFYFEEGELRLPMTMRQTPDEEAAGF